jgi:hypothetical protein
MGLLIFSFYQQTTEVGRNRQQRMLAYGISCLHTEKKGNVLLWIHSDEKCCHSVCVR